VRKQERLEVFLVEIQKKKKKKKKKKKERKKERKKEGLGVFSWLKGYT
jgi:hypothetical protein